MEFAESELIIQLKGGDRKAFEVIFKDYYQRLCTYAYSFLKDLDEAEEIVQHLFYQLWEKRTTTEINLSVKSYLYQSVHNHCLNKMKHLKVRAEHKEFVMREEKREDTTFQKVIGKELETKIAEEINSLPERCRMVFKLSRFENLKYAEIANQLDISEKTVENQMGKALKTLRENLKEYLTALVPLITFLIN